MAVVGSVLLQIGLTILAAYIDTKKYEKPIEADIETDFNNNRRNSFANSDYGSEGSWNAYLPLAKTCLVDWFTILPTLPYMYYFSSLSLIPAPKDWV